MKPGTRHRATRLAEALMAGDIEAVVKAVVAAAKGGDMAAAKIILDRICPIDRSGVLDNRIAEIERVLGISAEGGDTSIN